MVSKNKILAVVGATGAGKTALGVELAAAFDGVIISADSRQVYRGLDIGTNKEGEPADWQGEPARLINSTVQLLIDTTSPLQRFTLFDWLTEARRLIDKITEHGQLPIVVGGTGLYVTALLEGWQPGGSNQELRQQLETNSTAELQEAAADLGLNESDFANRVRLIRALERESTGLQSSRQEVPYDSLLLLIDRPVDWLYQKSDQRYPKIFDSLCYEVAELIRSGVSAEWLESLGLDYRYAARFVTGRFNRELAIAEFSQSSRHYIRRQLAWWRHHGQPILVDDADDAKRLVRGWLKDA